MPALNRQQTSSLSLDSLPLSLLPFARLPFLPSSPLSLFLFVTSPLCSPSPLPCCPLSVVAYLFTPEAENANYPRQKSVSPIVPFGDMRTGQGTVGRVESAGQ